MKRTLLLLGLFVTAGVPALGQKTADPAEGYRVLFVGNSLTYSHDLPRTVQAMLETADLGSVDVEAVAFPNFGLEDHWRHGPARKTIDRGSWDVVVLQQGPSATEGRPSLLAYGRRFAERIERTGARPAFFMVWPARSRSFDFDGVADAYRTAAERTGAILFPVGDAWRRAWALDPELQLYDRDGFHPSVLGSHLAALVIYGRLTGRDPRRLPAGLSPADVPPEIIRVLREAAASVLPARSSQ